MTWRSNVYTPITPDCLKEAELKGKNKTDCVRWYHCWLVDAVQICCTRCNSNTGRTHMSKMIFTNFIPNFYFTFQLWCVLCVLFIVGIECLTSIRYAVLCFKLMRLHNSGIISHLQAVHFPNLTYDYCGEKVRAVSSSLNLGDVWP